MGASKQSITFEDPDGNTVTEEWHFQLDETDAIEMDIVHDLLTMDNPEQYLRDIVENKDSRALLQLWRELLIHSVSRREGKLLVKDKETVRQFQYGGAYRQFFSDLITSDDAGNAFFMKIMPTRVQEKAAEEVARAYSDEELFAMTDEEFNKAAGTTKVEEMDKRFLPIAFRRRVGKAA